MTSHDLPSHPPRAYSRAALGIPHRRYWWRPLVTLVVAALVFVVMNA